MFVSHTCPAQPNLTLLSLCFAVRYCNIGGTNSYDCPLPALAYACRVPMLDRVHRGRIAGEYTGNLSCTEKQPPSLPPPSPPSPPPSPPPPPPMPPCATPIDFALVLDESGSMSNVMEGDDGLKAFAKELVRHTAMEPRGRHFPVTAH